MESVKKDFDISPLLDEELRTNTLLTLSRVREIGLMSEMEHRKAVAILSGNLDPAKEPLPLTGTLPKQEKESVNRKG